MIINACLRADLPVCEYGQEIHNYTLQTNRRQPQNTNSHKTPGIQLKQSNQLSLPRQDECKTRKETVMHNKTRPNREPPQTMGGTWNDESTTTAPQPEN